MVRLALLAAALVLPMACGKPEPAREVVATCHRQLLGSAPHQPGDIIDIMEHQDMALCVTAKGFTFLQDAAECSKRVIDVDNPACYRAPAKP